MAARRPCGGLSPLRSVPPSVRHRVAPAHAVTAETHHRPSDRLATRHVDGLTGLAEPDRTTGGAREAAPRRLVTARVVDGPERRPRARVVRPGESLLVDLGRASAVDRDRCGRHARLAPPGAGQRRPPRLRSRPDPARDPAARPRPGSCRPPGRSPARERARRAPAGEPVARPMTGRADDPAADPAARPAARPFVRRPPAPRDVLATVTHLSPGDHRETVPVASVQGTLALDLEPVPGEPAVPDLRVVPGGTADHRDLQEWAARFAQATVEVLGGDRPLAQLLRWTDAKVYADLDRRVRILGRTAPARAQRPRTVRPQVRSVHVFQPDAGLRRGQRARAARSPLAGHRGPARARDDRWRCVALQLG